MIPLPNVTGALHMGHALNGTLQDLITRWRRMQGYEALWMPGTDHAGIATQAVVERRMLEEEGLTRHDVGREALVNRIWKWKDAYERRILGQLKQLGASCDWRRTRFTLDEVCSKAVRRTFFKFFKDGLIYRGKRLVNWDTYLQTAVADDEVFDEEVDGHFWTFTYPVVDDAGNDTGQKIAFSTTRPETMLGDTAVCVHPSDDRYRNLVGQKVRIPLNGRLIPIIADGQLADPEMGTGAVKVTPAHDPNDYACFQRHPEIGLINILNSNGTMNENADPYRGQDRYQCRDSVIEKMEILGHFVEVADRKIPIKHSDRSKTPIEPYLSDQWFVKMEDLAQNAIDAVSDGRVKFFPSRFTKTYQDWLGEKRDWCISRQLWWGHRIPIWYCNTCSDEELQAAFGDRADINWRKSEDSDEWLICSETDLESDALGPNHKLSQDPDVLDTWFSSALWPHETLGWPDTDHDPPLAGQESEKTGKNEVLPYFYPGNVLVTARDIITLWVARMVLTGLYNMGEIPFHQVFIHPKILDGYGETMSKSKGNGVDP
ncbi:MAG: valine--tRNA ligase, partial [Planctomycetaceae bacterium]|nr:valine--tRNA ligase [Planctomycetaceae bacterium]